MHTILGSQIFGLLLTETKTLMLNLLCRIAQRTVIHNRTFQSQHNRQSHCQVRATGASSEGGVSWVIKCRKVKLDRLHTGNETTNSRPPFLCCLRSPLYVISSSNGTTPSDTDRTYCLDNPTGLSLTCPNGIFCSSSPTPEEYLTHFQFWPWKMVLVIVKQKGLLEPGVSSHPDEDCSAAAAAAPRAFRVHVSFHRDVKVNGSIIST